MRVAVVASALLLAACGGDRPERPAATFESFSAAEDAHCQFYRFDSSADNPADADPVFTTPARAPRNEANVVYAGERLNLGSAEGLRLDGEAESILWQIQEYPDFKVRLELDPTSTIVASGADRMVPVGTLYQGTLSMIGADGSTGALPSLAISGACGA